jgi:hypothetical protein
MDVKPSVLIEIKRRPAGLRRAFTIRVFLLICVQEQDIRFHCSGFLFPSFPVLFCYSSKTNGQIQNQFIG